MNLSEEKYPLFPPSKYGFRPNSAAARGLLFDTHLCPAMGWVLLLLSLSGTHAMILYPLLSESHIHLSGLEMPVNRLPCHHAGA